MKVQVKIKVKRFREIISFPGNNFYFPKIVPNKITKSVMYENGVREKRKDRQLRKSKSMFSNLKFELLF